MEDNKWDSDELTIMIKEYLSKVVDTPEMKAWRESQKGAGYSGNDECLIQLLNNKFPRERKIWK